MNARPIASVEPAALPGGSDSSFWAPPPPALPRDVSFLMTTRLGGVSTGPYAALNLGFRVGDRDEAVRENHRVVRDALALDEAGPLRLRQVHGVGLVTPSGAQGAADGWLLEAGDPWAAISVADCAAVALVAEDASRAALVHSGWRGTLDGIAPRALEALARDGAPRDTVHVVITPCIHAECYPVGPETAGRFPAFLVQPHPGGGFALDLPGAIANSLVAAGVSPERIHAASECTACHPERFYSHRRDRGLTGRHWALLRLPRAEG